MSRSFTPQGWYESHTAGKVHYQSGYEHKFMTWLDEHNIIWEKCKDRFIYYLDNKRHTYNPDIYLPKYNLYLEIKGMIRKKDPIKFEAFPKDKNLSLLGYDELKKLGLDVFNAENSEPDYTKWPFTILKNIDDFSERGILSEDLKERLSAEKFFKILRDENIYYDI